MKRLYEDYAYGPEPIKNCFWDRSVPLPQLPPLSGSRKVDVAVNWRRLYWTIGRITSGTGRG